jgi:uncharacterized SAM-binding protein YcdF (DUF218 family)
VTHRRALTVVLVAVAVTSLGAILAVWPFLFPTSDEPFEDGPVVALGGSYQRGESAARLTAERPHARPLLLSAWTDEDEAKAGIGCDLAEVECLEPVPPITFGEATMVAKLARQRGWDQVTVVTSAHHVTRSRRLFTRCVDVPVAVVAGHELDDSWSRRATRAWRELASWTASMVVHRDC